MDKETVIHTHTHTHTHTQSGLFSHKKKEILPFATIWINHEGTMLSEISQMGKAYTVLCNLEKPKKNLSSENRLVIARGRR